MTLLLIVSPCSAVRHDQWIYALCIMAYEVELIWLEYSFDSSDICCFFKTDFISNMYLL